MIIDVYLSMSTFCQMQLYPISLLPGQIQHQLKTETILKMKQQLYFITANGVLIISDFKNRTQDSLLREH